MRTIEIKAYQFKDLDEQTKEKVIQNNYHISVLDDWYDFTKHDLKEVGIELKSFDIDRGNHCNIQIDYVFNTCEKIIESHGANSETYKIAERFIKKYNSIQEEIDNLEQYENDDSDEEHLNKLMQLDKDLEDLDEEYQKEFSEEALSMLKQEYEHMTSEEYIIDMFEANEYEFTAEGKII